MTDNSPHDEEQPGADRPVVSCIKPLSFGFPQHQPCKVQSERDAVAYPETGSIRRCHPGEAEKSSDKTAKSGPSEFGDLQDIRKLCNESYLECSMVNPRSTHDEL